MALRGGTRYDDPKTTIVWNEYRDTADVASATHFARFRTRVSSVITSISVVCTSASSAGATNFTVYRWDAGTGYTTAASATGVTLALASSGTAGNVTTISCAITLGTAGMISLTHDDTGDYQVVYEYKVLWTEAQYDGT